MLKNGFIVVVLAAAAAADEDALSGPCRDARLVGPGERGGRAIDKYEQCQIAKSDACGNHYAKTYFCATSPASRFCFAALCLAARAGHESVVAVDGGVEGRVRVALPPELEDCLLYTSPSPRD